MESTLLNITLLLTFGMLLLAFVLAFVRENIFFCNRLFELFSTELVQIGQSNWGKPLCNSSFAIKHLDLHIFVLKTIPTKDWI